MSLQRLAIVVLLAGSCFGQNLLFKSGFESSSYLQPISSTAAGPSGYVQPFSGTDNSTGFAWPIPVNQPTGINGIHIEPCSSGDTQCSDLLTKHFNNYIDTSAHHNGNASLFLSYFGYTDNICCPQEPLQSSAFTKPLTSVYLRYWMMIPSGFSNQLANYSNYWRMVSENKAVGDYRMQLNANKSACASGSCPSGGSSVLHPEMMADARGQNTSYNCPYADPITGTYLTGCNIYQNEPYQYLNVNNLAITIPIGQWFEVEFYMKRSTGPDGRFFTAINGQTVADWSGPTYGVNLDPIQDMYWINMYTGHFPISEWIDDLEIWDAPPCTTLPCGANTGSGGGYTGVVPPSIQSYRGAVGAVGVPFKYQIQASNSPTSYRIAWNSLPAGLSLNTGTGLISGTPTSTGTSTVTIEADNSAGNGTEPLEFQINSSVQMPIIHDFWAAPSTTASTGASTTLSWNVLGAGSVALSINQGVGTVYGMSGSVVVNPTVTATYTLTASNSAGSTSKSVTVTVPAGSTLNPPTGLTAIVK